MKYEKISADDQKATLDARLAQFENEHYQHSLNLANLEASGATDDNTTEQIAAAKEAMKTLDKAHATVKAEIAKLDKSKGK